MNRTAVVILNWNGRKLLEQFLPALLEHTPENEADIIVADNGSTDDSLRFLDEYYPSIMQIVFDRNYGFAEGYNRALSQLGHEYVVLLNSDVEVSQGWLTSAISYLDTHPDVVALQPKILSWRNKDYFEYAGAAGGFMDRYGYPFCRGRILDVVEKDNGQYDDPVEVLWASGACLFIRRDVYNKSGGLDPHFFAHQEEIDLCWRLVSRGLKIVCLPASVVYHVGGATLSQERPRKTFLNFRNNLFMIYKNIPGKYLNKILFVRFFLDMLAAMQFLLKFQFAHTMAVLKAWGEFFRYKKNYVDIRKSNLLQSSPEYPATMCKGNVIFSFYFKGKKTYSNYMNN